MKGEAFSANEKLSITNTQLSKEIDELEGNNNVLNSLLASIQIPTILLDLDMRIRRFTPSCREILDISPSDEGRPISDFSSLIADDDLLKDCCMVLEKLEVSEREIRIGGEGWFLRRILPFHTVGNRIDGVVITLTDLSAIKQNFGQLETREHQQASVARLSQFALASHEPSELFGLASKLLAEALGVEKCKVLKLDPNEGFLTMVGGVGWDEKLVGTGRMLADFDSFAGYLLQSKGLVIFTRLADESRFCVPDLLTEHQVHCGLSCILGPPNHPWGILGAYSVEERDFTADDMDFVRAVARILTEEIRRNEIVAELEESRERLVIAQEAADVGIHDFKVEENKIFWDQRSRDIWGVEPAEEITFQTFLSGLHEDDRKTVREKVQKLLDPAGSRRFYQEYRVINRRDKSIRWIAASAKAFFRDGKAYRAVGTHMDITEKRAHMEEQASWAERLEEQVIERTCLAEQRAEGLRMLASQITTAEERARRKVAQVIHDDIQQILVAIKMRLPCGSGHPVTAEDLEIVTGLIDRGLAEARNLVSELSPPILHDGGFDKSLMWLAGHMEQTHRLKVKLNMEGEIEAVENSLGNLLFNIIRELLFNAVKHSGTDEAQVMARVDGEAMEVEVQDSGKGFDVAERYGETSGFGLFSIAERINAFGGTMDIDSAPGEGARFVIRIPMIRKQATDRAKRLTVSNNERPAQERSVCSERVRVMVVDDHEVVREGYVKILSVHSGLEIVATACDGEEAVKMAHQHQPDLILMDISMPKMNGIEATKIIKCDLKDTAIIGLSMHEEGVLGASMKRAGATAYLQKDLAGSSLLGKIMELFPALAQETPDEDSAEASQPTTEELT